MGCTHIVEGEEWTLLPEKAIYWAKEKILIVSDLHLGKISHFRKAGLAVPFTAKDKNLEQLSYLFLNHEIEKVLFLGDLFHSENNAATELYKELFSSFSQLTFILIKGNHDMFDMTVYEQLNLEVYESLEIGPFFFTHIPENSDTHYNIAGHIHPAVRLKGKGRSSLSHFALFWCIYWLIYHKTTTK